MLGTKCRYKFEVSGKSRTVWYKVEVPGMQWDLSGTVFAVSGCQGRSVRYKFEGSLKLELSGIKLKSPECIGICLGKFMKGMGCQG